MPSSLGVVVRAAALVAVAGLVLGVALWRPGSETGQNPSASDPPPHAQAPPRSVAERLRDEFAAMGLTLGAPVFVRIFKDPAELELWVDAGASYELFRRYPICAYSGGLGPKLREGDRQSPEGFYRVARGQLNPRSRYHLAFNLGFPNAYERARGWTGSFLMVHGACASIGCYAMGDAAIEEIYTAVQAALDAGDEAVPVHVFPFALTDEELARRAGSRWMSFWEELRPAYEAFEKRRVPPRVRVLGGRYVVDVEASAR
jgi:murein L,D-transpeptidase YafK